MGRVILAQLRSRRWRAVALLVPALLQRRLPVSTLLAED
jgi:hypothetical protein